MNAVSILKIGNPVLRRRCGLVSKAEIRKPEFRKILRRMGQTMRRFRGVGLAANQIGVSKRIVVMGVHEKSRYPGKQGFPFQICINPRILRRSRKIESDWEGCLSIPGYRGKVPRAAAVVLESLNERGERIVKSANGFEARVIQHELDHLDGILYPDRMTDLKSWIHVDEMNRLLNVSVRDE